MMTGYETKTSVLDKPHTNYPSVLSRKVFGPTTSRGTFKCPKKGNQSFVLLFQCANPTILMINNFCR